MSPSVTRARIFVFLIVLSTSPLYAQSEDFARDAYASGKASFEKGDWSSATDSMTRVLDYTSNDVLVLNAHFFRGYAYYKLGQCEQAARDLTYVVQHGRPSENPKQVSLARDVIAACSAPGRRSRDRNGKELIALGASEYQRTVREQDGRTKAVMVTTGVYQMHAQMVTNSEYERFNPNHKRATKSSCSECPATNVSWREAEDYCEWIGGRLPTNNEWEKACRNGGQALDFPWGEGADPDRACVYDYMCAVDKYAPSVLGFYDMAGNGTEWVYDDDSCLTQGSSGCSGRCGQRVLRKGPRGQPARCGEVTRTGSGRQLMTGFRCVLDATSRNNQQNAQSVSEALASTTVAGKDLKIEHIVGLSTATEGVILCGHEAEGGVTAVWKAEHDQECEWAPGRASSGSCSVIVVTASSVTTSSKVVSTRELQRYSGYRDAWSKRPVGEVTCSNADYLAMTVCQEQSCAVTLKRYDGETVGQWTFPDKGNSRRRVRGATSKGETHYFYGSLISKTSGKERSWVAVGAAGNQRDEALGPRGKVVYSDGDRFGIWDSSSGLVEARVYKEKLRTEGRSLHNAPNLIKWHKAGSRVWNGLGQDKQGISYFKVDLTNYVVKMKMYAAKSQDVFLLDTCTQGSRIYGVGRADYEYINPVTLRSHGFGLIIVYDENTDTWRETTLATSCHGEEITKILSCDEKGVIVAGSTTGSPEGRELFIAYIEDDAASVQ